MEDRGARAALFHALAEPTRLALLEHLASGEHRVRDLVDHMHLAQSTVSKHLACLRDCGLVTLRTEGRASWFALADPARLSAVLEDADAFLAGVADLEKVGVTWVQVSVPGDSLAHTLDAIEEFGTAVITQR